MSGGRPLIPALLLLLAMASSGCVAVNWARGNDDLEGKPAPALDAGTWVAPEGSTASDLVAATRREGRWAVVAFFRPD